MKITICACASRTFMKDDKIVRLACLARKAGVEVCIVDDICEMCEDRLPEVHEIAETTIIACYEKAVKAVMAFASETDCRCLDLRNDDVDDVLRALGVETDGEVDEVEAKAIQAQLDSFTRKQGADAWYPAISKSSCIECGKCFDFCPFGVYEKEEEKVRVVHPHNCKNNCPSCARLCPKGAIVFPKYDKSPINGGSAIEEVMGEMELKKLYDKALKAKLSERKKKIFTVKE